MKGLIYLNLLLFSFIPLKMLAQRQNGYEIIGRIDGLQEGEKVVMQLVYANGYDPAYPVNKDSAYVKNGQFALNGFVPDGPRDYRMIFDKHEDKICVLKIDNNERVTITGSDIEKIPHNYLQNFLKIDSSRANKTLMFLGPALTLYYQSMHRLDAYLEKLKDSVGFDPALVGGVIQSKEIIGQSLYYNFYWHMDTGFVYYPALLSSLVPMVSSVSHHPGWLKDVYDNLDAQTKTSFSAKILKDFISLCVGQPFPAFTLPDVDGKPLVLRDIVAKSKITLIQFWATNSYKRKEFQEELKVQYKRYHDKGLNIVGVSSDSIDYQWKGFVKAEKLPWYNVSDLKGYEGIVRTVYHEYGSVPETPNTTNVLIDSQGKILAWDVNGIELQWYLWKAFGE